MSLHSNKWLDYKLYFDIKKSIYKEVYIPINGQITNIYNSRKNHKLNEVYIPINGQITNLGIYRTDEWSASTFTFQ